LTTDNLCPILKRLSVLAERNPEDDTFSVIDCNIISCYFQLRRESVGIVVSNRFVIVIYETLFRLVVVHYETMKRNLNRRLTNECRWDERLKGKDKGSTRLVYTGLIGGLEHLKIETRLIDERFPSVMGECDLDDTGVSSIGLLELLILEGLLMIVDNVWN
jgi:hypothetical protein